MTLSLPFLAMVGYWLFAWLEWWPLSVLSVMTLTFVTYGSTSHDLVHRTLGLPRRLNHLLLSLIELLSLRSGTAYRLSHLHHHRHLLKPDDVEGATAHGSLAGSLLRGIITQGELWIWAWQRHRSYRLALAVEAVGIALLASVALLLIPLTLAPIVYVGLVVGGSWLFPLITVYFPHVADASGPLEQTRLFRAKWLQILAFHHFYHLEHHLYPQVPHHHWRTLAERLDPFFQSENIKPTL